MITKIYIPALKVCYPCCKPRIVHCHCTVQNEKAAKSVLESYYGYFIKNGYEVLDKNVFLLNIEL